MILWLVFMIGTRFIGLAWAFVLSVPVGLAASFIIGLLTGRLRPDTQDHVTPSA